MSWSAEPRTKHSFLFPPRLLGRIWEASLKNWWGEQVRKAPGQHQGLLPSSSFPLLLPFRVSCWTSWVLVWVEPFLFSLQLPRRVWEASLEPHIGEGNKLEKFQFRVRGQFYTACLLCFPGGFQYLPCFCFRPFILHLLFTLCISLEYTLYMSCIPVPPHETSITGREYF